MSDSDSETRLAIRHTDGVPDDAKRALARYGRVYVGKGVRKASHIHPTCKHLERSETINPLDHRAQIPIRTPVCSHCQQALTDEDGRLKPARKDGSVYDRSDVPAPHRRVCGCVDCSGEAFSVVEHPDHGTRAVCPRHRRRFPVVEVVADV